MSDLKLYRGINNIDDDLIEEADRRSRPVVHRFYAFAASAAALTEIEGVAAEAAQDMVAKISGGKVTAAAAKKAVKAALNG